MDDVRACVGAGRVSSSSKHIRHPSKHVRLSAGPGAATPNLLSRAGKAGAEEIGAGDGKEEREREAAVRAAQAAGEKTVALEVYLPSTAYSAPYHLVDLYPDADVWPNTSVAAYYGFDEVYGVFPEDAISPN
jgi:hypothetical protein